MGKQKDKTEDGTFNVFTKRPHLAEDVSDPKQALHWLRDVKHEISKKISEIQNAGLGEHRIRDLNDEINKLLRSKFHWETQIAKLGGPNYAAQQNSLDAFGHKVDGH